MINAAVIGLGYMGQVHLKILNGMPDVRIVGVYDADPGKRKEAAEKYHAEKCADSAEELLEDPGIDVIHNCTPNHLHYEINRQALLHSRHVLSEKPLAVSAEQSEELAELAKSQGLLTAVDLCYRYYPLVQDARARIRAGEIGAPRIVRGSFLQEWLLYETDYNWRLEPEYSGISNTIADIGSHWCDLAQFLTDSRIVSVMGDLRTLVPVRKAGKAAETFSAQPAGEYELKTMKLEDYGSVLLRFSNGMSGCFTASSLCAGKKVALDIEVYGSAASLQWSHERPAQLLIGHREKPSEILTEGPQLQLKESARYALLPTGHPLGYFDAVGNLFRCFYDGVAAGKKGEKPERGWPDFETGHCLNRIVEAVVESSSLGKWVDL